VSRLFHANRPRTLSQDEGSPLGKQLLGCTWVPLIPERPVNDSVVMHRHWPHKAPIGRIIAHQHFTAGVRLPFGPARRCSHRLLATMIKHNQARRAERSYDPGHLH